VALLAEGQRRQVEKGPNTDGSIPGACSDEAQGSASFVWAAGDAGHGKPRVCIEWPRMAWSIPAGTIEATNDGALGG